MGKPATRDVDCYRGDLYEHVLTFVEDDLVTPLDLSSAAVTASLREAPDGPLVLAFTIDETDADVGVIIISLDGNDTADLTKASYRYDVEWATGPQTLVRGKFTVLKDIT